MTGIEYLNSEDSPNIKACMGLNQIQMHVIAGILESYHKEQLNLYGVMPMLPKITSKEFRDYIKNNGYERIDDELLQKGKNYYCVNNVYRHFLNIIEFGN